MSVQQYYRCQYQCLDTPTILKTKIMERNNNYCDVSFSLHFILGELESKIVLETQMKNKVTTMRMSIFDRMELHHQNGVYIIKLINERFSV